MRNNEVALFMYTRVYRICILLIALLVAFMFAGCLNQNQNDAPYIAPMQLTASQQEIVNLISHMGQEILLFDYSTFGEFNEMEVWVEVLHYGESLGRFSGLHMFFDDAIPLGDGQLAISIHHQRDRNEYQWVISANGGTSHSPTWTHSGESMMRVFGPINEAVPITDGQEVIIYVSKFTGMSSIRQSHDFQYYLQYPESLAIYTYVHLIKARFSKRG